MAKIVWVANDNLLKLVDLQDEATGTYITDATVTVTVKDEDGTAVSGPNWPISGSYVVGTNATYHMLLPDTMVLTKDTHYWAFIDATKDALTGHWEYPLTARTRAV